MLIGSFAVSIPQGTEQADGYVVLEHGQVYTLQLRNMSDNKRCDAQVSVDGKDVGTFRLDAIRTLTLERPFHDTGCFTFYEASSAEASQAKVDNIAPVHRGLIQVRFKPEYAPKPQTKATHRYPRASGQHCNSSNSTTRGGLGYYGSKSTTGFDEAEEKTCTISAFDAGMTGLSGESKQSFYEVASLDYDATGEVVISLRLVSNKQNQPRELTPAPRSNPVPAPIS